MINEWLNENSKRIASELIEESKKSLLGSGLLESTTKPQIINLLRDLRLLIFPEVYEQKPEGATSFEDYISSKLDATALGLFDAILGVLAHECFVSKSNAQCSSRAQDITIKIMQSLPEIRKVLYTDIEAAYDGDPAAKSFEEIILSYPSIEAVSIYRIAHLMYSLEVPIIPRIITEYAHKNTGIDIHPGATIGKRFFIDHGTGVVIGETCTIGDNVKLYQGVTLGAKSFPLDENGNPIKGIKRHPDIQENVVIYAGATILGGDTVIGHDSTIGGNVWLTKSVPQYSKVFNDPPATVIK